VKKLLVGSFGSTVLPLSRRANFRNAEVRETLGHQQVLAIRLRVLEQSVG